MHATKSPNRATWEDSLVVALRSKITNSKSTKECHGHSADGDCGGIPTKGWSRMRSQEPVSHWRLHPPRERRDVVMPVGQRRNVVILIDKRSNVLTGAVVDEGLISPPRFPLRSISRCGLPNAHLSPFLGWLHAQLDQVRPDALSAFVPSLKSLLVFVVGGPPFALENPPNGLGRYLEVLGEDARGELAGVGLMHVPDALDGVWR